MRPPRCDSEPLGRRWVEYDDGSVLVQDAVQPSRGQVVGAGWYRVDSGGGVATFGWYESWDEASRDLPIGTISGPYASRPAAEEAS